MTLNILFWLIAVIGIVFGVLDYRGDPNNHRWGYLMWVVVLIEIALLGYRVFPFNLN